AISVHPRQDGHSRSARGPLHCPSENEVLYEQRAGGYSAWGYRVGEEMLRGSN
ncbi:hypothetical protein A2U01_0098367, partial [Trifolium medium]|nr:hypothetical protein [Trifolium medium]